MRKVAARITKANRRGFGLVWLLVCVALVMLACGAPDSVISVTPVAHTPAPTPPEVIVGEALTNHFNGVEALDTRGGQSRWRSGIDASLLDPSWLVEDSGIVYAGALDHLLAFAVADGTRLWDTHLPFNPDYVHALAGGMLYGISFNPCDVSASGACVYAIDARTGTVRWTYEADPLNHLLSPQVVGGVLYTAGEDDMVYALRADTGALLWRQQPSGAKHYIAPSLAVGGDIVYMGSGDGRLYALDGGTGSTLWSYESPATNPYPQIPSVPHVALAGSLIYEATARDALTALDAKTGAVRWTLATHGAVLEAPIQSDGALYITTAGDGVYALDATTGSVKWHALAGAVLSGPATVAQGMLYCVTFDDGVVYALDASSGTARWHAQAGTSGGLTHDVALLGLADGALFVSDRADAPSVSVWDATTGTLRWHLQPAIAPGTALAAILVA